MIINLIRKFNEKSLLEISKIDISSLNFDK